MNFFEWVGVVVVGVFVASVVFVTVAVAVALIFEWRDLRREQRNEQRYRP